MQLFRNIVVTHKTGPDKGKEQGTIFMFLMADPPRGSDVDKRFGRRNVSLGDIVSGKGRDDTFGVP